jgi:hypothetical protein
MQKTIKEFINLEREWEQCLAGIKQWSYGIGATFGVTGSALSKNTDINDLDLIVILSDPLQTSLLTSQNLPSGFSDRAWREYLELYKLRNIEVFVTHHKVYDQLRLELYPLHVAERILALEQFTVRRIRQGALVDKKTIFYGTDGTTRRLTTRPVPMYGASYAESESCMWEGNTLFVGVHLERLLLSRFILDGLQVEDLRRASWSHLGELFSGLLKDELPFDGKLERIFHIAEKLPIPMRQRIRRILLKQEENRRLYDDWRKVRNFES